MIWKYDEVIVDGDYIKARFKVLGDRTLRSSLETFLRSLVGQVPIRDLDEIECYNALRSDGGADIPSEVNAYNSAEFRNAHWALQRVKEARGMTCDTPGSGG